MKGSAQKRGFSIPELLIVCGLFSIFSLVSYSLLNSGVKLWLSSESSRDVTEQLQKARAILQTDLKEASIDEILVSRTAQPDESFETGDILNLLSPYNPELENMGRRHDGTALWQRNVLYYSAIIKEHDRVFPVNCPGQSRQSVCPHKVLVRRVLDTGVRTRPQSPDKEVETLLPLRDLKAELLIPDNLTSSLESSDTRRSPIVALGLVQVRFEFPAVGGLPGEVRVKLQGFDVSQAGKNVLFNQDLSKSPYTHTVDFSVFPDNTESL